MRLVEVMRKPDPATLEELRVFVTRDAAQHGRRRLSDHLWLDLLHGGAPGYLGVRVLAADREPQAYAQISAASGGAQLEALGTDAEALDAAETALDLFARDGGGPLTWWADDPTPELASRATAYGLAPSRELHEMRRALPHERRATVATRAFQPGVDDDAWLAVNNRAFAEHPEQGGWTRDVLATRVTEDWFDPEGFRLHEIDGRVAAFCWTKVHPATGAEPALGEIYVIAVGPEFHGRGLGAELTLAGLDHLADRGIPVANLYVDGGNTAAVGLYHRLGFHIHRTRTAFTGNAALI